MTISPPPEIKRSYPFVDLTKYIAAVMVIMIHTNPLGAAQDSWLYTFTYTILRNALPFFFLSSSYFFFKKRNWSKYIKRLFILYFSWFVLLFVYVIYIKFYSAPGPWEMKLLSFCKDLIWNGALPGAWYVVASLHSVVLLYFLSLKLKFNNTALIVVGVCLYCVSLLNSTYYGFAADNECLMVMNQVLSIVMPSPAHSFFSAFIFFVIGKIIAENQHRAKLRYYVIGLIGFGILEFVETGLLYHFNLIKENDYYFMLIPFAYCFFQLCLIAKVNIDSKRTSYMRKCSIICYFSQFPIIFICGVLTKYLPFGIDFANFVITIVAANILSYMIIRYSDCYAVLKNLY